MLKKLLGVLAVLILTLPMGVAIANGGNPGGDKGPKGEACPDASPNPERVPPPGCGRDLDGTGTGTGTGGTGTGTGGTTGNACPPQTPGHPNTPPPGCGHGTTTGSSTTGSSTTGSSTTGSSTTGSSTTGSSTTGSSTTGSSTTGTSTTGTSTTGEAHPCRTNPETGQPAGINLPLTDDGGTLADQLYHAGLSQIPLFQDPGQPNADSPTGAPGPFGPLSQPLYENIPAPLGEEIACVVNFPVIDL